MKLPAHIPRATYRVQMHAGFTFGQLTRLVPYLSGLGISDIYLSPIFLAPKGSTHGYDVCDHNEINPELGGREGLDALSVAVKEHGMSVVTDFVPNHMGIQGSSNWRWMEILEDGKLSRFASFFDIEWNPRQTSLQDRIIVPVLHDFYGRVLEAGEIRIEYRDSAFWACYRTLRFPMSPESYRLVLHRLAWLKDPASEISHRLEKLGEQFNALPRPISADNLDESRERRRGRDLLRQQLADLIASENLSAELNQALQVLNGTPKNPESFDGLHEILEAQNYRLAYWKTGTHEINYRRFFAIDTLVGLRMESQEVFDESHRLLKELIEAEIVSGVRIDHIDGLLNPAEYLQRLSGLATPGGQPLYSVVEKILTEKEELPLTWQTHGTTGYEFAGELIDLFVDPSSEAEFTRIYREFTGITINPDEQAYRIKLHIMDDLFPNALDNFALDLEARVKTDRRWRDWTVSDLRPALSQIIACLSVYRTYRVPGQPACAEDIDVVERAVSEALRLNHAADPAPFHFIRDLWTGRYPDEKAGSELKAWAENWISQLQQYTGAIMAKSVEDTFFYRYVRLFATNEVGHHPAQFGRPVAEFHEANQKRLRDWPVSLLGTSTHDTKMSEDVRARLAALSEMPEPWGAALHRWSKLNHQAKTLENNLLAPDANEEYLLYQILLGAWPLQLEEVDAGFAARIKAYMQKALSESKAHTNWATPDQGWLAASDKFIDTLLDRKSSGAFWEDFVPFADQLAVKGMKMSLVQTVLKLTSPGVPDFYQGTELWDFSLVDPDNRRPVDYERRLSYSQGPDQASAQEMFAAWKDGRIKMHIIRAVLRYRLKYSTLFSHGSYTPLQVASPQSDRFISFLRQENERQLFVVGLRRLKDDSLFEACGDGTLTLPKPASIWRDLLTGREIQPAGSDIPLSDLLVDLPVAVYVS